MRLKVESKICTGCRICMLICSNRRGGAIASSRVKIGDHESLVGHDIRVCVQCKAKPCIKSCGAMAIYVDEKTGATIVDTRKCNGCGDCVKACPFDGISLFDEKAIMCDLCGGTPACVTACPVEAIKKKE